MPHQASNQWGKVREGIWKISENDRQNKPQVRLLSINTPLGLSLGYPNSPLEIINASTFIVIQIVHHVSLIMDVLRFQSVCGLKQEAPTSFS